MWSYFPDTCCEPFKCEVEDSVRDIGEGIRPDVQQSCFYKLLAIEPIFSMLFS